MTSLRGVIHGKTIELETAPGLPDGEVVSVIVGARCRLAKAFGNRQAPGRTQAMSWMSGLRKCGTAESRGHGRKLKKRGGNYSSPLILIFSMATSPMVSI